MTLNRPFTVKPFNVAELKQFCKEKWIPPQSRKRQCQLLKMLNCSQLFSFSRPGMAIVRATIYIHSACSTLLSPPESLHRLPESFLSSTKDLVQGCHHDRHQPPWGCCSVQQLQQWRYLQTQCPQSSPECCQSSAEELKSTRAWALARHSQHILSFSLRKGIFIAAWQVNISIN